MSLPLEERIGYHPDPNQPTGGRSKRKVEARHRLIRGNVDFSGKRVLDLGCSGGYFGFALSDTVSSYLGVDGDEPVIERNRNVARQRSLVNVEFQSAAITPSYIRGQAPVDVALFLSVFHHMLGGSDAYDWNRPGEFDPFDLLRALRERADVLVFETGYPDEGYDWCDRLPPMTPTPRAWVVRTLREAGFRHVEVVPAGTGRSFTEGLRRSVARAMGYARHPRPLAGRIAAHVFQVDSRDNRDLFIARNN